ncbi:MAG: hypothetical protein LUP99_02670 [Methanomicrobiales archaeon]|nr:hypothetical protein [Methanomicrobiales archaeon]
MKIREHEPPREFRAGPVRIRHCATINLEPDEQVTFITSDGHEYDVVRKDWGYYATPSMNGRLREQGLRSALVSNNQGKIFLRLVEQERVEAFRAYLAQQQEFLLSWLDSDEEVLSLLKSLGAQPPPALLEEKRR